MSTLRVKYDGHTLVENKDVFLKLSHVFDSYVRGLKTNVLDRSLLMGNILALFLYNESTAHQSAFTNERKTFLLSDESK